MATDEQKKENRLRITMLSLGSLAAGVWNTLGESSFALSGPMGEVVLGVMEKEMGLEIAGEDPHEVLMEMGRIFVDELGICGDIDVSANGGDSFEIKVKNCANYYFTEKLLQAGVEKPFICPILNACEVALRRMDYKMRGDVQQWVEGKGSIITFKGI